MKNESFFSILFLLVICECQFLLANVQLGVSDLIANNTAKNHLKTLVRTFRLTYGDIVNAIN